MSQKHKLYGDLLVTGDFETNLLTVGGLAVDTNLIYTDTVNGNVGIGTTTPNRKLDVQGTDNTVISVVAPTDKLSQLALGNTDDDNYAQLILDNATNKLQIQNGGGSIISDRGITLDSSERVGIGISSPQAELHVNGGTTTTPAMIVVQNPADGNLDGDAAIQFRFAGGSFAGQILVGKDTTWYSSNNFTKRTNMEFSTTYQGTNNVWMRADWQRNVRIYKNLTIYDTSTATYLKIKASEYNSPQFSLLTNDLGYGYGYINYAGKGLRVRSTDFNESSFTDRMLLTLGGNLLIGTMTDSGYKLDVNGTANATGFSANGVAGYTGTFTIIQDAPNPPINVEVTGGIITNVT